MKNISASVLLLLCLIGSSYAYTVHIAAPAVLVNIDRGVLTSISLNVTNGNGTVTVSSGGSGTIAQDTLASADTAAAYAASYLALNESKYNFAYLIHTNDSNVSGPSAGLAMTLLAVAGLKHVQLNSNFTVTGTISSNGTVGQIGGVFDKVQAANSIHARYILVPYLSKSNYQYLFYYLSQQAYDVPVIEVKNISQAVPYAIGNPQIEPLTYNLSQNYHVAGLPNATAVCPSCNVSEFGALMNFTFNFTQAQINSINSTNFGSIRSQLESQLDQYSQIGLKGYQYSAADLAFNEYPTAFVFSNYNTANYNSALGTLNGVSAYCDSVNATPQLTNKNYEYVFGGQTRREWAQLTLNAAYEELNASQTSDDILLLLETAAPAYSWCLATGQMYNIANSLGGTPIALSPYAQTQAAASLQGVEQYGNDLLYVNASKQAYLAGDYGAALYSAQYAKIFYNDSNLAYSMANSVNATVANALASQNGVWPQEFALQSRFYLYQASVSNSTLAPLYLDQAYTTALLSEGLGSVNVDLQSDFVAAPLTENSNVTSEISNLQGEVSLMIGALIIIILFLAVIILVLIIHLTKGSDGDKKAIMPVNTSATSTPITKKSKSKRQR